MTLRVHQALAFRLVPSALLLLFLLFYFFFPPSARLSLLREKWHVGTDVLAHTTLV